LNTQCNQDSLQFHPLGGRKVRERFDGGGMTSDAGGLLFREANKRARILAQFAACFTCPTSAEMRPLSEVLYMAAPCGSINVRVMKSAYEYGYALIGKCNEGMYSPDSMTLPESVNRVNVRCMFLFRPFGTLSKVIPTSTCGDRSGRPYCGCPNRSSAGDSFTWEYSPGAFIGLCRP
jgi:hypothetical protein